MCNLGILVQEFNSIDNLQKERVSDCFGKFSILLDQSKQVPILAILKAQIHLLINLASSISLDDWVLTGLRVNILKDLIYLLKNDALLLGHLLEILFENLNCSLLYRFSILNEVDITAEAIAELLFNFQEATLMEKTLLQGVEVIFTFTEILV